MKWIKKLTMIVTLAGIYILYVFFLREGEIFQIYQETYSDEKWNSGECKSTVVLVDNAPLSPYALQKLWEKNGSKIIKTWSPFINDKCDEILFVKNNIGRPVHSSDSQYWIADEEICLKGRIDGCIDWDDRLFYIDMGKAFWSDDVNVDIDGIPFHIHFVNN